MIRLLETWYDEDPGDLSPYDLWISHQRSRPVSENRWLYYFTIQIDLTPPPETILARMRGNVARLVKQAQARQGLSHTISQKPSQAELDDFLKFFQSNQGPCDQERLHALRTADLLHIASVQNGDGQTLVMHALLPLASAKAVQLDLTASAYHSAEDRTVSNAIGAASRWLVFQECLHYRDQGFSIYDLRGWYPGKEDKKRLSINQYKEGFRGQVVIGYDCEEPMTLKGLFYLKLRDIRRRFYEPGLFQEMQRRRSLPPNPQP